MAPTDRIVVADAGPLIHLDELACLDLLADFGEVLVPDAVWREVEHHRLKALVSAAGFLARRTVGETSPLVQAMIPLYTLHSGEQEALHLCAKHPNSLLLTDDTAARLAAKSLGIAAHGTVGLLIRAIRRQTRTPSEVVALMREIPGRTTLHIRRSLLDSLIAEVEATR
jgi:predicted nucleic acid-binding protein